MLTIEKIKNEVFPLAEKYNIDKVELFGSYAKGMENEKSDVDFLVKFIKPVPSIFAVMGFKEELQRKLEINVDIVTLPLENPSKIKIERSVSIYGQ